MFSLSGRLFSPPLWLVSKRNSRAKGNPGIVAAPETWFIARGGWLPEAGGLVREEPGDHHHAQPVQLLVRLPGELLEELRPERPVLLVAAALRNARVSAQLGLLRLRPVLVSSCRHQQVGLNIIQGDLFWEVIYPVGSHSFQDECLDIECNFRLRCRVFTQFTLKPNRRSAVMGTVPFVR